MSGNAYTQGYETASLDPAKATLTFREYETDPRVPVRPEDWSFAGLDEAGEVVESATDCLLPAGFRRGWIYELLYTAKNPLVMGLGFTGVRDLIDWLRHDDVDSDGAPNPLRESGTGIEKAYGWGCSQSARFLREFVYRGYNEDRGGKAVFDGICPFVAGAGRVTLNYRFAQPGRYPRQHFDHLFPSDQFPFAYSVIDDPLTGQTDGILKRPESDPFVVHTQASSEYWQRRGSLVHTDVMGEDLADHEKSRVYLFASAEHAPDPLQGPREGLARYPTNPLDVGSLLRAMQDNLDDWVTRGTLPPESRVPRRGDGTALSGDEVLGSFPRYRMSTGPEALTGFLCKIMVRNLARVCCRSSHRWRTVLANTWCWFRVSTPMATRFPASAALTSWCRLPLTWVGTYVGLAKPRSRCARCTGAICRFRLTKRSEPRRTTRVNRANRVIRRYMPILKSWKKRSTRWLSNGCY